MGSRVEFAQYSGFYRTNTSRPGQGGRKRRGKVDQGMGSWTGVGEYSSKWLLLKRLTDWESEGKFVIFQWINEIDFVFLFFFDQLKKFKLPSGGINKGVKSNRGEIKSLYNFLYIFISFFRDLFRKP